ncbi:helix-turn-helix transcriptional regulator [Flavobacterium algicola]|uniref:helix-turn-helix transcriptional regulator n=1 Tax=Flavobacterium algicola TaxID=556529 RepID=UPI001EFCC96A|nr:WYL domain-containing protein [Flavobacterium algicola]MCG9793389.1 WYL domain-containing protein [Flavobacterium algicola]
MTKLENDDLGDKFEFSSRTFIRDKADILDLFGIEIVYNRKDKVYCINDEVEAPAVSRMIEAFSIHQALKDGNKISPSIYLEKRKVTGTHLINGILHAIQNRLMISFTHTKFWDMEISERTVKPIAIKESEHRWYLIAQDEKDGSIKNFGFDRISNLKILDTKFRPITFDVDNNYQHAFGIETYEAPEKVVLSFTWQQGNYIKSFPLHSSQKITKDTDEELVVELFIHPTNEIVMELLKYDSNVKVIAPVSLRNEMKKRIKKMVEIYK